MNLIPAPAVLLTEKQLESRPELTLLMRAMTILNSLDIDQERLASDMNSEKVNRVIMKDIEDALTMGVKATPEFFVNGQALPSWGFEQLSRLVEETVADVY